MKDPITVPNYLSTSKSLDLVGKIRKAGLVFPNISFDRLMAIGIGMIPIPNLAELIRMMPPEQIKDWMFMVGDVPSELSKVLIRLIELNPERVREHWKNI